MSLDLTATVYCDHANCKNCEDVSLTETVSFGYPSWDARNVRKDMERRGWTVTSDGGSFPSFEYFCSEHSDEETVS